MRIMFIQPPRWRGYVMYRGDRCEQPTPGFVCTPYWLLAAAAWLKEKIPNIKIKISDANAENQDFEWIKKEIKSFSPEIIVFTGANCSISYDLKVATIVKKHSPSIQTLLLEPILSLYNPQKIFRLCMDLDIILMGEMEFFLEKLCLNEPLENVPGIIYRRENKIIQNEPKFVEEMDNLPIPAYDLIDLKNYSTVGVKTTRGCPFNCSFCLLGGTTIKHGFRKYGWMSAKRVVDELELLQDKYNIKRVYFLDETFTIPKNRVTAICNEIKNRNLKLTWYCQTRSDCVDYNLLKTMKEANCTLVQFGVESGSQSSLQNISKKIQLSQTEKAFRWSHQLGLNTGVFLIYGLPNETTEDIRKTLNFTMGLKPDIVQISTATPLPGTKFYEECKQNDWLCVSEDNAEEAIFERTCCVRYKNLDRSVLEKELKRSFWRLNLYYISPKSLWFTAQKYGLGKMINTVLMRGLYILRYFKRDIPGIHYLKGKIVISRCSRW